MLKCSFLHRSYHISIVQFLLSYFSFCFGMICQAKASDSPPVVSNKRTQRISMHVVKIHRHQWKYWTSWHFMIGGSGKPKLLSWPVKLLEGGITVCTCMAPYVVFPFIFIYRHYNHCPSEAGLVFWMLTLIMQPTTNQACDLNKLLAHCPTITVRSGAFSLGFGVVFSYAPKKHSKLIRYSYKSSVLHCHERFPGSGKEISYSLSQYNRLPH